jgi:hypothetical protein
VYDRVDVSYYLITFISNSILCNNKKQLKFQEFNTVKCKKIDKYNKKSFILMTGFITKASFAAATKS